MESYCPKCGTPGLAYAGSQLQCGSCDYTRTLAKEARALEARPLSTPDINPGTSGLGLDELLAFSCQDCNVNILSTRRPATACPFCGGGIDEEPVEEVPEVLTPALVLPFTFSHEAAKKKLKNWVDVNPLRPPGLAEGFDEAKLHGVFVPFWLYDVYVEATWKAKAGYFYFNRLQEEDPHNTGEPWEVHKIRYADTGGYYANTFQHMLISSEKNAVSKLVSKLVEEAPVKELVPYDAGYLEDFAYVVQKDNTDKATEAATKKINKQVEDAAGEEVDADFHKEVDMQLRMEGLSLRHVLIPVWIVAMKYRGKTYHACIDGRTGKVEGEQPWSPFRIGLLLAFICVLIFLTVIVLDKWVL
ncbi:MAG: hypothetical protein AB8F95_20680 [Bacteroidia bacterium]